MKNLVDMHMHSHYSDGSFSPELLALMVKHLGLRGACLTDHENFQGVTQFLQAAKKLKLEVLTGMEVTCQHNGFFYHLLLYKIKELMNSKDFFRVLIKNQEIFHQRGERVLQQFKDNGLLFPEITICQIKEELAIPAPFFHFSKVYLYHSFINNIPLKQTKELAGQHGIIFGDTLEVSKLPEIADVLKIASELGCLPVMAHLGITALLDSVPEKDFYIQANTFVKELIPYGLKGVEVYHSSHNDWQEYCLKEIAQENNLFITGGSDFHGAINTSKRDLGSKGITLEQFNQIKVA